MSIHHPRVVFVSGCSAGFGFRSARALARAGHHVVAGVRTFSRHGQQYAAELKALRAEGHRVTLVPLDVDRDESVAHAVDAAMQAAGRIDVLVNTAAYSVLGPLEACRPKQLLAMFDTNVVGALRLFRAVLPIMREQGGGRIVQITSGLGRVVLPFMGVYAASAWAQEAFAEALAYEAQGFGVEVAILEPAGYRRGGRPRKPVGDEARLSAYQDALIAFGERVNQSDPAEGDPEEVARAVVELVEAEKVPLRTPVGEAAVELLRMRRTLSAEAFEREIYERTGLHAVYEDEEEEADVSAVLAAAEAAVSPGESDDETPAGRE